MFNFSLLCPPFIAKINETDTFGPGDDDEIQFDDIGDDDEDIDDVSILWALQKIVTMVIRLLWSAVSRK